MDKAEILNFLNETEEGKAIVDELKTPLLNKRDELFTQLKTYKDELEEFKMSQATAQEEVDAKLRAEEEAKLKQSNDFEAYKQFHDDEISKYKSQLNDFQSKYAQKEAERVITATASKYSRAPKPLELLLRERIQPQYDESGNVNLIVKGDNGDPMYYEGQPASVEQLVETLKSKDDYAPFFAATGVSGSGTQASAKATTGSSKDMNSPDFNLSKAMGNKL